MLTGTDKLLAVRAIGPPRDLSIDLAPEVLAGWRARAEKKVTEQLVNVFKKVPGKENTLFELAEASLGEPERAALRPEATVPPARPDPGGRGVLRRGSGQRPFSAAALGLPTSAVYITKEKPEPGRPRVCRSISNSPSAG
ncbi:hypothetical protein RKD28_002161 [Streptomyces sp. SAI-229]